MKANVQKLLRSTTTFSAALGVVLAGMVSAHADTLYISTAGDSTVTTYNTANNGGSTTTGNTTVLINRGALAAPEQLAFDSAGVLYVANPNGVSVAEYTSPTTYTTVLSSNTSYQPSGLAIAPNGRTVYVANSFSNTIFSYDPANATPTPTSFATGLNTPIGLAIDNTGSLAGDLFVANKGGSIAAFNPGGTAITLSTFGGLSQPEGLAFDPAGNLYVADFAAGTVSEFAGSSLTGGTATLVASIGGLSGPRGLAFDSAGNLYVTEFSSGAVAEVTPGLTSLTTIITGLNEPAFITVPEPSTWALLAGGMGMLIALCRRKTRLA